MEIRLLCSFKLCTMYELASNAILRLHLKNFRTTISYINVNAIFSYKSIIIYVFKACLAHTQTQGISHLKTKVKTILKSFTIRVYRCKFMILQMRVCVYAYAALANITATSLQVFINRKWQLLFVMTTVQWLLLVKCYYEDDVFVS